MVMCGVVCACVCVCVRVCVCMCVCVQDVRAVAGLGNASERGGLWPQLAMDVSYTGCISLRVSTKVRQGHVSYMFAHACTYVHVRTHVIHACMHVHVHVLWVKATGHGSLRIACWVACMYAPSCTQPLQHARKLARSAGRALCLQNEIAA